MEFKKLRSRPVSCYRMSCIDVCTFTTQSSVILQKPQPPSGSSSFKREKYCWENKRILISASPPQLSYNSAVASSCRADCCDGMLHPSPFISTTIRDKLLVAPSDLISPSTLLFSFSSPQLSSTCASISKVLHSTSLSSPLFSRSAIKSQSEARKAASLSSLDFSAAVSLPYCSVLFSPAFDVTHTLREEILSPRPSNQNWSLQDTVKSLLTSSLK